MTSSFLTFDTHVDIPWTERNQEGLPAWEMEDQEDVWLLETSRRFTIPKALEGGLKAACLAAYIPQASLDQKGHEAAWCRVQAMLKAIKAYASQERQEEVRLCCTVKNIQYAVEAGAMAIVPVVENGYALGEDPARMRFLAREYGVRYMTLTHNGHNLLADSAVAKNEPEERYGGLSSLGRDVIHVMNHEAVLVDVSHTSRKTMMQAVACSQVPVLASHSCVRALCDHPRNLDDSQLDALKESGGVIQITAMAPFLRKGGGGTLADFVMHVRYAVERIGIEHVGISSDFDGGGGVVGWADASESHAVSAALAKAGFDDSERAALWGGNALRLMTLAEQYSYGDCQGKNAEGDR